MRLLPRTSPSRAPSPGGVRLGGFAAGALDLTNREGRIVQTLVNLTPHPVRVFGWDVPDRFHLDEHEPLTVIEPSGIVARIGEIDLGTQHLRNCPVPVEYVEYRHVNGLPEPSRIIGGSHDIWYIVSLALALAATDRGDLLVPYREIRDPDGSVIGCRLLARPV